MVDIRKSVLITGCSSGIGHSLARKLHERGLRVFATARSTSSLSDLEALGIEPLKLTVDNPESVAALKSKIEGTTGGRLDYLINNAGANYTVPALDVDFDEVRQCFETNVFGVMRICQAFAPMLIAAKGCIVQIGSVAATFPYVFGSTYNASKAALHAYSNTLRVELAPFGVSVITVITGGVQSRIARTERHLPESSLYLPIKKEYQKRVTHSQDGAMSSDAYAESVVNKILGNQKRLFIWEGNKSWLVWFVNTFLPLRSADWAMWHMFNLWKLVNARSRSA